MNGIVRLLDIERDGHRRHLSDQDWEGRVFQVDEVTSRKNRSMWKACIFENWKVFLLCIL